MPLESRALGSFESGAAATNEAWPFVAVGVVCLENGPPDDVLRTALDVLQARTPLARARLVRDGGHRRFEGALAPVPLELRLRAGADDWHAAAEEQLNRPFDVSTGPLLRAVYSRSGQGQGAAELVLAFHHSIVDAASGIQWVDDLLRLCADPPAMTSGGGPLPSGPESFPPSTDALFPPALRGAPGIARRAAYMAREMAGELAYHVRNRGLPAPAIPATGTCRILPRALEPAVTARLSAEARRRRITLNSVLSAALGLAVWRRRYGSRPMTLRALAFADLRPYLQPEVPPTTLACHIAMMRYPVPLRPGLGLWEVAESFQRRLYRSARRGEKFHATRLTKLVMETLLRARSVRMAHTALSYAGPLRLAAQYGSIRLRRVHAFVSNIPVGPEFTALARLDGDQILWDFTYLAEDMDVTEAEGLAAEVLDILDDRREGPR